MVWWHSDWFSHKYTVTVVRYDIPQNSIEFTADWSVILAAILPFILQRLQNVNLQKFSTCNFENFTSAVYIYIPSNGYICLTLNIAGLSGFK